MAKKPAKKKSARKKPVKRKAARKPAKKAVKKPAKKAPRKKPVKKVAAKKPEQASKAVQIIMGVISYLWILFIIPLLAMRKDELVHFHAKQGLVLFLSSIAVSIFTVIPYVGWTVGPVLHLVLLVFWVIAIVHALLRKKWKMPLLGTWAERLDL